jgi:ClpP class serine protease
MTIWLLERTAALDFESARAKHVFTGDQIVAFDRLVQAEAAWGGTIGRVAGSTCEIPVTGILTKARDRLAWALGMGNTTYADIRSALASAQADHSIKSIVLRVDSPGGMVDGLFETIDAISACTKPVVAVCDLAASAAYGLAAAAKRIEATGRASMFGSIGVATSYSYWNAETLVELTNTDSPDKRPDARTDAGKKVIVDQLDAIAALFMDSIASGRRTTTATVKSTYGRGSVLLASAAKQAGMIDGVRASAPLSATSASLASADRGDQIIALLDAKKAGLSRSAQERGTGDATSQAYDVGDAIVALLDQASTGAAASQAPDLADAIVALAARPPAPEPNEGVRQTAGQSKSFDRGDQIVELMDANREGRAPEAWATAPVDSIQRVAMKKVEAFHETVAAAQENREPAPWARALWP